MANKPIPGPRPSKGGSAKFKRNLIKCARYRTLVGKPNGRGKPGNKAGAKHKRVGE